MFPLKLLHQCDSDEYKQYIIFNIKKKKITPNYPKFAAMGFFLGTQERIRNSRGKRALSVRATEVILYVLYFVYSIGAGRFRIFGVQSLEYWGGGGGQGGQNS